MERTRQRVRDEWIALRCQSGEPQGFADLVREFERPLLYYAIKLVGDEARALDVLQAVWLAAFGTIKKLDEPASVRAWLYQMTRGRAIDFVRSDRSRARAEHARAEAFASQEESLPDDDNDDLPDAATLHQALDQIELKHREVLVLHFLEEMSVDEVARVVGCPPGTVKSRIHYAKRALREALTRQNYGT